MKKILIAALLLLSIPVLAEYPNAMKEATDNWLRNTTEEDGRGIGGGDKPNGDVTAPNGTPTSVGDCLWLVAALALGYVGVRLQVAPRLRKIRKESRE
jgi:hypothetical protein